MRSPACIAAFLLLVVPTAPAPMQATESSRQQEPRAIISFPSAVGEVEFPHQMHFDDMEVECQTCHHEVNAANLDYPHEDYFADFWIDCRTCHRDNPEPTYAQACDHCHHDASACKTCADETLSPKVVIHLSCWQCHEIATGEAASRSCKTCHAGPKSAR